MVLLVAMFAFTKSTLRTMASQVPPIGSVLAFAGMQGQIPHGWHICDGRDGTLDLTGKFVRCVTPEDSGEIGGSRHHRHKADLKTTSNVPGKFWTRGWNANR